ncbi:hypothetical protein Y032_0042g519 [Ancylostoma ceylanicum]|uniref:Uncharacterized protein n=2 Tax=Ancylostoma ceylanicum TaxID=53326 RepID=A0A016UFX8_9BILA|nr:hypothetical protein Y032_0042g519 [Ancylostoma ceylanicum]
MIMRSCNPSLIKTVTFVCSILFIIVDAYTNTYCDKASINTTSRWISPCDLYSRHKSPYASYILLMLLKHVQLFHMRTLAAAIEAKVK